MTLAIIGLAVIAICTIGFGIFYWALDPRHLAAEERHELLRRVHGSGGAKPPASNLSHPTSPNSCSNHSHQLRSDQPSPDFRQ